MSLQRYENNKPRQLVATFSAGVNLWRTRILCFKGSQLHEKIKLQKKKIATVAFKETQFKEYKIGFKRGRREPEHLTL